jgi:hypothetical protein
MVGDDRNSKQNKMNTPPSQELFHTNKSLKTCLKPSSMKGKSSHILSPTSVTLDDDQSIVSNLSKSTFLSNTSSLTWPTFLAETEGDRYNGEEKEDGDHSIIYDKNKNKYKRITMKAKYGEGGPSFENTLDRMFLHLYDAIVDTDALQISCVNDNNLNAVDVEEEVVMKTFVKLPAESSSSKDAIFTHSNQTTFVSHEANNKNKNKNNNNNDDDDENLHFIPICLTTPTSTKHNFLKMKNSYQSSSLNMDGLTRSHSIINSHSIISLNEDDDQNDPSNLDEKIQTDNTEGPVSTKPNETTPTAMMGSSLDQMPIDNYQSEIKITTSSLAVGASSLEETSSLEGIEVVDELGHIMDTHTKDVYVMYKIEDDQPDEEVHDDNVILSQLQNNRNMNNSSGTKDTSTNKLQLFHSLRKMKFFSSRTGMEDTNHNTKKNNNKTRITRMNEKKRRNNGRDCDSPGGATTTTLPSNSVGSSSFEVFEDDNSTFSSVFDINRTIIEI